jgi:hypothetical protein
MVLILAPFTSRFIHCCVHSSPPRTDSTAAMGSDRFGDNFNFDTPGDKIKPAAALVGVVCWYCGLSSILCGGERHKAMGAHKICQECPPGNLWCLCCGKSRGGICLLLSPPKLIYALKGNICVDCLSVCSVFKRRSYFSHEK